MLFFTMLLTVIPEATDEKIKMIPQISIVISVGSLFLSILLSG